MSASRIACLGPSISVMVVQIEIQIRTSKNLNPPISPLAPIALGSG
jgi:hypothetical protein